MTYLLIIPKEFDLICTYPSCKNHVDVFRLFIRNGGKPIKAIVQCEEHVVKTGGCQRCGPFCGHLESFDFSSPLLDNCPFCGEVIACEFDEDDDQEEF